MKKLLLSSPQFSGEIEVLYDENLVLSVIDMSRSSLTETQIEYLVKKIPASYNNDFLKAFGTTRLSVTEEKFTITFEMFYEAYNLKRNAARCVKVWDRLSKSDQIKAFYGVKIYLRYLANETYRRSQADPETYLSKRYWESDWSKGN